MELARSHDYLGPQWVACSFDLMMDDGGAPRGRPDVCVVTHENDIRELLARTRSERGCAPAVLYLPGFIDTFYHVEQARAWREVGIPFVGLDFRRSGRALRDPRGRDDIRDLTVRYEDIDVAADYLRECGADTIIVLGHSTGGLQAVVWAADRWMRGAVDLLILNSPWLDHNGPAAERAVAASLAKMLAPVAPRAVLSRLKGTYARSLHVNYGGEFFFNEEHKPTGVSPVFAGFLNAVFTAQDHVKEGLGIPVPILLAHSDASGSFKRPTPEELASTDCVLNVADMVRLAPNLGDDVTLLEVPGGRHDLACSKRRARGYYTRQCIAWTLEKLGWGK